MAPRNKAQTVKTASEKARQYTPKHHSCSKGTLLALQEAFGIKDESAFKAASGLHGGIGGKGDVCGSLLGASLMIGLMCGDSIAASGKQKNPPGPAGAPPPPDTPTRLVGELYDWFGREFGSVKCDKIRKKHEKEVNADPATKGLSEDERMFRIHSRCDELCGMTAAQAAKMLLEELKK